MKTSGRKQEDNIHTVSIKPLEAAKFLFSCFVNTVTAKHCAPESYTAFGFQEQWTHGICIICRSTSVGVCPRATLAENLVLHFSGANLQWLISSCLMGHFNLPFHLLLSLWGSDEVIVCQVSPLWSHSSPLQLMMMWACSGGHSVLWNYRKILFPIKLPACSCVCVIRRRLWIPRVFTQQQADTLLSDFSGHSDLDLSSARPIQMVSVSFWPISTTFK